MNTQADTVFELRLFELFLWQWLIMFVQGSGFIYSMYSVFGAVTTYVSSKRFFFCFNNVKFHVVAVTRCCWEHFLQRPHFSYPAICRYGLICGKSSRVVEEGTCHWFSIVLDFLDIRAKRCLHCCFCAYFAEILPWSLCALRALVECTVLQAGTCSLFERQPSFPFDGRQQWCTESFGGPPS